MENGNVMIIYMERYKTCHLGIYFFYIVMGKRHFSLKIRKNRDSLYDILSQNCLETLRILMNHNGEIFGIPNPKT